ncbi:MAG TPA: hypothetical protein VMQ51_15230 [Candidatus Binatia bacterium]|nr:hypothetical protein [Candidatus Binatia bacterium]
MPTSREETTQHLEIVAGGDRQDMEALQLEIRRLAREHGVEIVSVEIVPAAPRRAVSARRRARRRRG